MTDGGTGRADEAQARIDRLERRLERERSARRAAEEIAERHTRSLYDANRDLDRKIAERTAELDAALTIASRASEAKSAFLAQMSHQLKTPLHGMLGMLELLGPEIDDDRLSAWISSCQRSTLRLDRLVERLIQYASIEGQDLVSGSPLAPLADVMQAAAERWRGRCMQVGQLLTVEDSPPGRPLVAAPPELHLVLDELLSNAVDHAGHGAVRLFARTGEGDVGVEGEGWVDIDIYDPGPGVDEALVRRAHLLAGPDNPTIVGDRDFGVGLAIIDATVRGLWGTWRTVDDGTQRGIRVSLPTPVPGPSDNPHLGQS